jgi:hypothetical protein
VEIESPLGKNKFENILQSLMHKNGDGEDLISRKFHLSQTLTKSLNHVGKTNKSIEIPELNKFK